MMQLKESVHPGPGTCSAAKVPVFHYKPIPPNQGIQYEGEGIPPNRQKKACLMINPSKEPPPLQFCGICPYWVPGLVHYHGKRTSHAPPRPEHVTVIHVDSLFISSNDILPDPKKELVWHEMCNPSLTTRILHFGGAQSKNQPMGKGSCIQMPNPGPQLRKGHIAVTLLESSCACSNGHLWSSVVLAVSHIFRVLAAIQIMVLHVIQKNNPSPHEVPSRL